MDMCEISLGEDLKETNEIDVIAAHSLLWSISKNESADYFFKPLSAYTRQNSVNESMECNGIYIDTTDKGNTNFKRLNEDTEKPPDNIFREKFIKPYFLKQISAISTVEEHLVKKTINDTVMNMPSESSERRAYTSNDSGWSTDSYGAKQRPWLQRGSCIFAMSGFSCVVSMLTVAFVVLVLNRVSSCTDGHTEIVSSMGQSYHDKLTSESHIAGSFKLNQTYLHEHSNVNWLPDEHSRIIPNRSNDCLVVPFSGKYLVISRFTFNVLPKDTTTTLTHSFKLKTRAGDMKDGGFKRKYVSILENKLREHSETEAHLELRKASVFIEFFFLDAEDQICANVSNPDLLYESSMDNDINIIKV